MIKRFFAIFLCCTMIFPMMPASAPRTADARTENGIDVSEWQGRIRWKKVASTRIRYVYIRACIGSGYTDSQFRRNHRLAKRYGLKTGFYHYITARAPPRVRMRRSCERACRASCTGSRYSARASSSSILAHRSSAFSAHRRTSPSSLRCGRLSSTFAHYK